MPASERLAWAADLVDPAPGARILEVGCGHGVLVSLLADRLTTGVVVGVDRSPTMIAAAARRNRAAMGSGRVRLHQVALGRDELPEQGFDVVVSFNVRAFWSPPGAVWDVVDRVLSPDGRVVVAFSVMGPGAEVPIRDAIRRSAAARGLGLAGEHRARTAPMESVALDLRRAPRHPSG